MYGTNVMVQVVLKVELTRHRFLYCKSFDVGFVWKLTERRAWFWLVQALPESGGSVSIPSGRGSGHKVAGLLLRSSCYHKMDI